jgi:ERCC4-related helicase
MFYRKSRSQPYELKIINQCLFTNATNSLVSIYTNDNRNNFPIIKIKEVKVEMHSEQERLHKLIQTKTLGKLNSKNLLKNLALLGERSNKSISVAKLNSFLHQTRQISNVVKGGDFVTPKIEMIYNNIIFKNKNNKENFPAVVYSNFKEAGIYPLISYILLQNPYLEIDIIDGSLTSSQKYEVVQKYNERKIKILFITSAAGEGIDLKNTKQLHIMEPHWNDAKIQQIIGRGARYQSHKYLPITNRNMTVYKYCSVYKKENNNNNQGYTADQYLIDMSKRKSHIISLFEKFLNLPNTNTNCFSNNNYIGDNSPPANFV